MKEKWISDFEELLGKPINQQVIIDFFREVLKDYKKKEKCGTCITWENGVTTCICPGCDYHS